MKKQKRYMLSFLLGTGIAAVFLFKLQQNCIDRWKRLEKKNRALFLLMDEWVKIKQDGKKLESYFKKNNLKRIAVYGMSNVGKCLVRELNASEIEIVYGIDKNSANIYSKIKLVTADSVLQEVDAVVVALVDGYEEVCDSLSESLDCPIIAIEDIINAI